MCEQCDDDDIDLMFQDLNGDVQIQVLDTNGTKETEETMKSLPFNGEAQKRFDDAIAAAKQALSEGAIGGFMMVSKADPAISPDGYQAGQTFACPAEGLFSLGYNMGRSSKGGAQTFFHITKGVHHGLHSDGSEVMQPN